jgi:hypothetical protein
MIRFALSYELLLAMAEMAFPAGTPRDDADPWSLVLSLR